MGKGKERREARREKRTWWEDYQAGRTARVESRTERRANFWAEVTARTQSRQYGRTERKDIKETGKTEQKALKQMAKTERTGLRHLGDVGMYGALGGTSLNGKSSVKGGAGFDILASPFFWPGVVGLGLFFYMRNTKGGK